MANPKRRLTPAQIAAEQYGSEPRGHDSGEMPGPLGGSTSQAAEDYSTTGLFRDENFGRDSCGVGEPRVADHSWEGPRGRGARIYEDTAESNFSIRNATGIEDELEEELEWEGSTEEAGAVVDKQGAPKPAPQRTPIRRRRKVLKG
jgi:hypothetical protein